MGLVDYSDDSDDEPEAAAPISLPAPKPQLPPPPEPEAPPAKKAKKEINLRNLLQKHDAALPFEDAAKLPADFFASAPIEKDAGEEPESAPSSNRGWAALSAMLPPPKNKPKAGSGSIQSLYDRAKPLNRPPAAAGASVSAASASPSSQQPPQQPLQPPPQPQPPGASSFGPAVPDDTMTMMAPPPPAAASSTSSLLPRLRVGMYDEPDARAAGASASAAASSSSSMMYDVPLGPALGPEAADGAVESAYGAAPYGLDEQNVVSVSQEAMLRAMGPAKQYEFHAPPPANEAKIAANFWSRTSGSVEAQYKASSLQKRKHQINSLAADSAHLAAEIALRGGKAMKSKKETAAKYGW